MQAASITQITNGACGPIVAFSCSALMDIHTETMIRHRHQAIDLLGKARAASDRVAAEAFERIIREWDNLLARHGIGPESPGSL
jgi:uncharacterized protein (DUF305 family)